MNSESILSHVAYSDLSTRTEEAIRKGLEECIGCMITIPDYVNRTRGTGRDSYHLGLRSDGSPARSNDRTLLLLDTEVKRDNIYLKGIDTMRSADKGSNHAFRCFRVLSWDLDTVKLGNFANDDEVKRLRKEWGIEEEPMYDESKSVRIV